MCPRQFLVCTVEIPVKFHLETSKTIVRQVIHIRSRKDTAVVTIPESDKPVTKRDIEKLYDLSFLFVFYGLTAIARFWFYI